MDGTSLDFDCGIAYKRLFTWLDEELALERRDGLWAFEDAGELCLIGLAPLESRTFNNLAIERTHLTAEGAPAALETFERLFTLRFISAGG